MDKTERKKTRLGVQKTDRPIFLQTNGTTEARRHPPKHELIYHVHTSIVAR